MDHHDAEIVHCLINEQDERALAQFVTSAAARECHLMIADRYADRARALVRDALISRE